MDCQFIDHVVVASLSISMMRQWIMLVYSLLIVFQHRMLTIQMIQWPLIFNIHGYLDTLTISHWIAVCLFHINCIFHSLLLRFRSSHWRGFLRWVNSIWISIVKCIKISQVSNQNPSPVRPSGLFRLPAFFQPLPLSLVSHLNSSRSLFLNDMYFRMSNSTKF